MSPEPIRLSRAYKVIYECNNCLSRNLVQFGRGDPAPIVVAHECSTCGRSESHSKIGPGMAEDAKS